MLVIVLGTRPEIVKTAPIIFEAKKRGLAIGVVHTGQHYAKELDERFFSELNLPAPIGHVHVGSHSPARQVGLMMQRLEEVLTDIRPSAVMVQGDTNSVLAGALVANKMKIPLAHLEAGLRSDDWTMPEETNRVLADRISRWLFCPTELQRERVLQEGIMADSIHVVGNTVVDAAQHFSAIAYEKSDIAERLQLAGRPYIFLTMHRPSNVDDVERLRAWLISLDALAQALACRIIFPVHPRTASQFASHRISMPAAFTNIEPLGYLDALRLMASAEGIITDSGGLQEEACVLRVPCITLRHNTERPETVQVGANILVGDPHVEPLLEIARRHFATSRTWANPFGNGKTAERVVDILISGGVW